MMTLGLALGSNFVTPNMRNYREISCIRRMIKTKLGTWECLFISVTGLMLHVTMWAAYHDLAADVDY